MLTDKLERVELIEAKMYDMETELSELKAKMEHLDECNCNLTGIEHDIRQNGIEIAKVRHLVVLNDNRISENLDQINENQEKTIANQDKINANEIEIESTIETVRLDLETLIGMVKLDVESNQGKIQSITTDLNVRIFCTLTSNSTNCSKLHLSDRI